jgi:hypothetical protein
MMYLSKIVSLRNSINAHLNNHNLDLKVKNSKYGQEWGIGDGD